MRMWLAGFGPDVFVVKNIDDLHLMRN